MTLHDLKCFAAVAEARSFTGAARRLFLTQPALSRKIAALEREVGQPLFIRSSRSVRLTASGEALKARADKVLSAWRAVERDVDQIRRGEIGQIALGYNPIPGQPRSLVEALRRMAADHPLVHIELHRHYAPALLEGLMDGSLDCCIISSGYTDDIDWVECAHIEPTRHSLLMSTRHPLAARADAALSACAGEPFIVIDRALAPVLFDNTMALCAAAGFVPHVGAVVREIDELIVLVCAAQGVAIVSSPQNARWDGGLRAIELPWQGVPAHNRQLIWRKGSRNPCVARLRDVLAQYTQQYSTLSDV